MRRRGRAKKVVVELGVRLHAGVVYIFREANGITFQRVSVPVHVSFLELNSFFSLVLGICWRYDFVFSRKEFLSLCVLQTIHLLGTQPHIFHGGQGTWNSLVFSQFVHKRLIDD